MVKEPFPEKTPEERRIQTEKHKVETERSLAVANTKMAHSLIETIEKQRSRGKVISLQMRIADHSSTIRILVDRLSPILENNAFSGYEENEMLNKTMQIYKSIRKDFQESLELKDEKMEELFPEINTYYETPRQAAAKLVNIQAEENQMMAYSNRILL